MEIKSNNLTPAQSDLLAHIGAAQPMDRGYYVAAKCAATGEDFVTGPFSTRTAASVNFWQVDWEALGYLWNERGDVFPFGFQVA
jgi:hypothetical protein